MLRIQHISSPLANKILPNQVRLLPPLALPLQVHLPVELVEEQSQVSSWVLSLSSLWPEWHSTYAGETGLLHLYSATRNLRALKIFHRFLIRHLQHTLPTPQNSQSNQANHQLRDQSLAHMKVGQHKALDSKCDLQVLKWPRLVE